MNNHIIQLRTGTKGKLKASHPWIYKHQIYASRSSAKPGDIVSVVNAKGAFVGRGYYNPASAISVRLLTFNDEPVNNEFFSKKIKEAVEKRKGLLSQTNAYRAIFSEADSLPGLILDIYSDTAVFQVFTLGMERFKEIIIDNIRDILKPKYIYEKSDSSIRELEGLSDIKIWYSKGSNIVEIFEGSPDGRPGKTKFYVDVENGHKTGFYLDQRKSRLALSGISKDKKILDLFCYTGAFAIACAAYGAKEVYAVDTKQAWLELGAKNAHLNNVSEKIEFIGADAFSFLKEKHSAGEKFDIIIIDPPSFLKTKRALQPAIKGYKELNTTAMKALNEGGVLCTFSCSHHMPNDIFSQILKDAAKEAGKTFAILKRCHQDKDHPIVREIPETEYLKGYFLKIS